MARWATVKEAANYMRLKEQTIYNAISKGTKLGSLFTKAEECRRVADLDEIDKLMRGDK